MKTDEDSRSLPYNAREITNNVIGDFLYDQVSGNSGTLHLLLFLIKMQSIEIASLQADLHAVNAKLDRLLARQDST